MSDTDAPLDTPPTDFSHVVYESLDPPKEPEPEIHGDRAGLDEAAAELRQTKAERGETVERSWGDPRDWSKHAPGNYQVSAEHAADMLRETRDAEARPAQSEIDAATAREVDDFRAGDAAQPQQPEFQQTQPLQPQPEYAPPENPELDRLLSALPPEGRAPFLDNYNRLTQQAQYTASMQYAEALQRQAAVEQQFHQGVQNAGQIAIAGLLAAFPELNGLGGDPARLQVALQTLEKANPQRHQQLANHISQVRQTVSLAQQQVQQEQVRQHAVAQQQRQQQQEQFQRFAEYHDSRVGDVPREVQEEIVAAAAEHGVSKQELLALWSSSEVLRHSGFQSLLADGARYRLAQRSVAKAATRPVAHVQKPGTISDEGRDYSEYAQVANRYRGQSLNPRQAAELLIAKRARR